GAQWEGRLYRFRLFNEFASGCSNVDLSCGADGGPCKTTLNPNGNNSCNDLYLQDANGGFVGEDDGGTFILLDDTQAFTDAGFPVKSPKTLAVPIWEAADLLAQRENAIVKGLALPSTVDAGRLILVADGGSPTFWSDLVQFNDFDASVPAMTVAMKLGGVNSPFCTDM